MPNATDSQRNPRAIPPRTIPREGVSLQNDSKGAESDSIPLRAWCGNAILFLVKSTGILGSQIPRGPRRLRRAPEKSYERSDFTSRKGLNSLGSLAQRFHDPGREMYLRASPKIQGVGRWPKNHPRLRIRRSALHRRARRRPPPVRETCTPSSSRHGGTRAAVSWSRLIFRGWSSGVAETPSFESIDRPESIGPVNSATGPSRDTSWCARGSGAAVGGGPNRWGAVIRSGAAS